MSECDCEDSCYYQECPPEQPPRKFSRHYQRVEDLKHPWSKTTIVVVTCFGMLLLISLFMAVAVTSGIGGATSLRGGSRW